MPVPAPLPAVRSWLCHGACILLAGLLVKCFVFSVHFVPSASMQPTLVGDPSRLRSDWFVTSALSPQWRLPRRWDLATMAYPLRRSETVVKRLVGLPGERIRFAGGNLLVAQGVEPAAEFVAADKPRDVQDALWREVHPHRMRARGGNRQLGEYLLPVGEGVWLESATALSSDLGGGMVAGFDYVDPIEGGVTDHPMDGQPFAAGPSMQIDRQRRGTAIVPDVKLVANFAGQGLESVTLGIRVHRPSHGELVYALEVGKFESRISIGDGGGSERLSAAAETPDGQSPAGVISFVVCDEVVTAILPSGLALTLAVGAHHCRDDCEQVGWPTMPVLGSATPFVRMRGSGRVTVTDLKIWRDVHYRSDYPAAIEVPARHFFVLGDNPAASHDSRSWRLHAVGLDVAGSLVPPTTGGASTLRFEARGVAPGASDLPTTNPLVIPARQRLVVVDEFGQTHRLRGAPTPRFGSRAADGTPGLWFHAPHGADAWQATVTPAPFVHQDLLTGRVLFAVWPPIWGRIGRKR